MLLEFSDAKHLCIANTWFRKADNKTIHMAQAVTKARSIIA